jgi:hypothetical protein
VVPPPPVQQNTGPAVNISTEDSSELTRLMKRLSGDYTYTKQIHYPDGSASDVGYAVATMSIVLNPDLTLTQKYLICHVSNPQSRTDGYVISANTPYDCDKRVHNLQWEEKTETAPATQINPSSIQIVEIDKHASASNLALSIGYVDQEKSATGFTILRCRNRGTCGEMAADLKSIVDIARKYVPAANTN